jgi:predicted acetyltransferase
VNGEEPPGELHRLGEAHTDEVMRQRRLSFGPGEETDSYVRDGLANGEYRGFLRGGQLLANCRLAAVDHWFGGRRVPCQHVMSVAVPPEHRGTRLGKALTRAAIGEGARAGLGLSILFPATTGLYRGLGYELAGTFTRYRLDAARAPVVGPAMRPATDRDWPAIRACHERHAAALSGPAVPTDAEWERLARSEHCYVLDDTAGLGQVEAFLVFDQVQEPGDWRYVLKIAEWAATSSHGLAALVGFVGRHGTLGKAATFRGPVPEPWSLLVGEQHVEASGSFKWMVRGLDPAAAIAARGFPDTVTAEISLTIDDSLLPDAAGPWRLHIDNGRAALTASGQRSGADEVLDGAGVRLDARGFGPLFTGMYSAETLALAGLASGPPEALAQLSSAFAGPLPTLHHIF